MCHTNIIRFKESLRRSMEDCCYLSSMIDTEIGHGAAMYAVAEAEAEAEEIIVSLSLDTGAEVNMRDDMQGCRKRVVASDLMVMVYSTCVS